MILPRKKKRARRRTPKPKAPRATSAELLDRIFVGLSDKQFALARTARS